MDDTWRYTIASNQSVLTLAPANKSGTWLRLSSTGELWVDPDLKPDEAARKFLKAVHPQYQALLSELDSYRKDAERYRWLRDHCTANDAFGWIASPGDAAAKNARLDAAVKGQGR